VCCALALLVKPMALHVGAPLLLLLVAASFRRPACARDASVCRRRSAFVCLLVDLALYGAIVAAICGVVILALGPAQVWDHLGAYRTGAGHQFGADRATNLRLTANVMAQEQPGLYVAAAAGLVLGLWWRPAIALALVSWAAAVVGLFSVYGDLADKHIVYLVPPIALLAAVGVGVAGEAALGWARSARHDDRGWTAVRPGSIATLAVGLVGLVGYLWFLPSVYRSDVFLIREAPKIAAERRGRAVDQEIADIIRTHTPPDGWVLSDNPGAAFDAGRLVIPYLVDTSGTRIDAGSLTTRLAIDQIQRYRPSVIVTWPRRLAKLDDLVLALPGLGYRLERSYPLGWKVYVRE
jgi:hypothetical protein